MVVAILAVSMVLYVLAGALAPVLTGLVIAFLLQGLVDRLQNAGCPRLLAILIAMIVLLGSVFAIVLLVVPLVWQQASSLPGAGAVSDRHVARWAVRVSRALSRVYSEEQILDVVNESSKELGNLSAFLLESAFSQVFSLFGLLIYLVLVPISVFFLLKDKEVLMAHAVSLLPKEKPLLDAVGVEMNAQLGNYVRGKAIEILLVGSVSFITFVFWFELRSLAQRGGGTFCFGALYRGRDCHLARVRYCRAAIWLVLGSGLGDVGLCNHSVFRWQRSRASAFF